MKKTKESTKKILNTAADEYFSLRVARKNSYNSYQHSSGTYVNVPSSLTEPLKSERLQPNFNNSVKTWIPHPWNMEKCCYKILQDKFSKENITKTIGQQNIEDSFYSHMRSIQHIAKKFKVTQKELRLVVTNKKFLNKIFK